MGPSKRIEKSPEMENPFSSIRSSLETKSRNGASRNGGLGNSYGASEDAPGNYGSMKRRGRTSQAQGYMQQADSLLGGPSVDSSQYGAPSNSMYGGGGGYGGAPQYQQQ